MDLSSCSIMLVILLLTGFVINLANAKEEVLTSGMETTSPDNPLDEHGHEIYAQRVNVSYNREDSCFQRPVQPYIMSHSILVQLDSTAFNTGFGTIICYVGQLDPLNQELGIHPSPPYFVRNRKNNSIANECEKAREKLPKDKFTNQTWHGFQLRQKEENSNILFLSLSTSNHNFEIPRLLFKDGRLFIKLTRWNSNVALLSNTIGPGFNGMRVKQQKEIGMNDTLRNDYMSKVGQGAMMDKYVGPWTLGVDILPRWHGSNPLKEEINFYVLRSNCSELAVSFLRPSDVAIANTNTPRMVRSNPAWELVKLTIGFVIEIRARVHDNPTNFTVRLTTTEEESKYVGAGLLMQFDNEHDVTIPVFQFYNNTIPDWQTVPSVTPRHGSNTSLPFRTGQLFILKILSLESTFKLGVNCGPYVTFNRTTNISAITRMKIEVGGGVDVYKISTSQGGLLKDGIIRERAEGWALDPNRGYLLRGTNLTHIDAWAIIVTFMYASGDTNKLLFKFVARRSTVEELYVQTDRNVTYYNISLLEEFTKEGAFELHFILKCEKRRGDHTLTGPNTNADAVHENIVERAEEGSSSSETNLSLIIGDNNMAKPEQLKLIKRGCTFELLLNDVALGNISFSYILPVEVIKIIADVEAIEENITFIPPLLFQKPDVVSSVDTYTLFGKVPKYCRWFAINFLYKKTKENDTLTLEDVPEICLYPKLDNPLQELDECQSALEIKMVNESTTTFSSFYKHGPKKVFNIVNATSLSILRGHDFQMNITSSKGAGIKLQHFTIDVIVLNSNNDRQLPQQQYIIPKLAEFPHRPNHIMLTGDIFLFNEPDVYSSAPPVPVAIQPKPLGNSGHTLHLKSLARYNVTNVQEEDDKMNGTSVGLNGTNF